MSSRASMALAGAMAATWLACSSESGPPPAAPPPDAGGGVVGIPGVPWVTLTTTTPVTSLAAAAKTSATWAAYRKEDGSWSALAESSPGSATYAFQTRADRWAVAFACADSDSSLVAVHEDVIATTSAEIELETYCATTAPDRVTISGTLSHLSNDAAWLDFGYALEVRGAVLPTVGASASYEEVNVAAGTWDMAFGIRNAPSSTFSKIAFIRNHALTVDATLDIDLAGASAVVPGTQSIHIHGYEPAHETIQIPVYYATSGGPRGIDLGPQDIPDVGELALAYGTVPAAGQAPGDRYRAEVTATASDGTTSRGFVADFHDAVPLDLSLAAPLTPPAVQIVASAPYERISSDVAARAGAAVYEMLASANVSNRSSRAWRLTTSAALVASDVTLTIPDLSAVPGFSPTWALPTTIERVVTVTVHETPVAMGDGSQTHFVANTTWLEP